MTELQPNQNYLAEEFGEPLLLNTDWDGSDDQGESSERMDSVRDLAPKTLSPPRNRIDSGESFG